MKYFVYLILDPRNNRIPNSGEHAYVGVTDNTKRRLKCHLKPSTKETYASRWMLLLLRAGFKPVMQVQCVVSTREEAFRIEIEFIQVLRSRGVKLTNTTNGGIGGKWSSELSEEQKELARKRRKPMTLERRLAISKAQVGKTQTNETRDQISKTSKGRPKPWLVGRKLSQEQRDKISASLRGRKKTEAHIQAVVTARCNLSTPEALAAYELLKSKNLVGSLSRKPDPRKRVDSGIVFL